MALEQGESPRKADAADRDRAVLESIPLYRKLAYVALQLAALLLLVEVGMRITFWLKEDLPPTPDVSLNYEWKWARSHVAKGSAETQAGGLYEYDADLGWRLVPNHDDGLAVTNSQGLRADREYVPGPHPDGRRLALLGDSFTYGSHVANDETFGHLLETQEMPGWEVVNLAVSGYGTDQALLAYERRAAELAPNVVVMGFYVDDYERNILRFKVYAKPVFEPVGEALRLSNHPVIPPQVLYEEYASGRRRLGVSFMVPYLGLYTAKAWRKLWEGWPREEDLGWRVLTRLMRRFRDHVKGQGALPVWLVIPYRDVVSEERSRFAAIEEICEREAKELGLPLLRVDTALRQHAARHPEVALYRSRDIGGHHSVDGHRVVARALGAFLRDLVPTTAGPRARGVIASDP